MQTQVPIRLFYDTNSSTKPGKPGVMFWRIKNVTSESIKSITISSKPSIKEIKIESSSNNYPLHENDEWDCAQEIDLTRLPDLEEFEISPEITLEMESGEKYLIYSLKYTHVDDILSKKSKLYASFKDAAFIDKGDFSDFDEVHIEVEGDLNVYNTSFTPGQNVHIKANAGGIGNTNLSKRKQAKVSQGSKEEDFYEIPDLRCVKVNNTLKAQPTPISLNSFIQKLTSQASIHIDFVNVDEDALGKTSNLGQVYRLAIQAPATGYLTLISQGAKGTYFLLYPHTNAYKKRVHNQIIYWPDQLLGEQKNAFEFKDDLGTESVLALLSPEPLLEGEDTQFSNEQLPAKLTPQQVSQLLQKVQSMESFDWGYTQITITE